MISNRIFEPNSDAFNLQRFLHAQDPVYQCVLSELKTGRKASHWMWFIFPQIRGLGRSPVATEYAISSLEEASAYLKHPVLGPRLTQCTTPGSPCGRSVNRGNLRIS